VMNNDGKEDEAAANIAKVLIGSDR
jgi:hypothetical protein